MHERNIFELAEKGRADLPKEEGLLPSEILKIMFYSGLAGSKLTDQVIEALKTAFFIGAALGFEREKNK